MNVEPDPRPGFYYVSVMRDEGDGARAFLRGPFTTHREALDAVPAARAKAEELDARACWYLFGTARCEVDAGPGVLDKLEARAS